MTFDEWHDEQDFGGPGEWWKDHRDPLSAAWKSLEASGVSAEAITDVFDTVTNAIRDQYGD